MEHVLCVPMAFKDEPTGLSPHMVYMCSCEAMQNAVQEAIGLEIDAKGSYTGHARSMSL